MKLFLMRLTLFFGGIALFVAGQVFNSGLGTILGVVILILCCIWAEIKSPSFVRIVFMHQLICGVPSVRVKYWETIIAWRDLDAEVLLKKWMDEECIDFTGPDADILRLAYTRLHFLVGQRGMEDLFHDLFSLLRVEKRLKKHRKKDTSPKITPAPV